MRHMNTRRTTPPPLPPSKLEGRIRQVAELARDIKLLRLRGCLRDFCYHFVQAMQSVIKLNRVRSDGWRRTLCNQIQSNAASNSLKFNQTLPLSSILLSSPLACTARPPLLFMEAYAIIPSFAVSPRLQPLFSEGLVAMRWQFAWGNKGGVDVTCEGLLPTSAVRCM